MDTYQERYLAHQKRKKQELSPAIIHQPIKYTYQERSALRKIMGNRHSQRVFNGTITDEELTYILEAAQTTPSSCNRRGVTIRVITQREDKEVLNGLLVGGVGWVHRADKVLLLLADMEAYKNPVERDFMPYLDAGVMVQAVYLASEVQGVGCCYINPNIRPDNQTFFKQKFGNYLFCGALALGKY